MEFATPKCPFCTLAPPRVLAEGEFVVASRDYYPVSDGHTLVFPKRHVLSIFDLNEGEFAALWQMVTGVRAELVRTHRPTAFNIGINDGTAAGQTVPHAHVHVIPRYDGDVRDPRGGVRWVIPSKATYWDK